MANHLEQALYRYLKVAHLATCAGVLVLLGARHLPRTSRLGSTPPTLFLNLIRSSSSPFSSSSSSSSSSFSSSSPFFCFFLRLGFEKKNYGNVWNIIGGSSLGIRLTTMHLVMQKKNEIGGSRPHAKKKCQKKWTFFFCFLFFMGGATPPISFFFHDEMHSS